MQCGTHPSRVVLSAVQPRAAHGSTAASRTLSWRHRGGLQSGVQRPNQTCCSNAAERPMAEAQQAAARQQPDAQPAAAQQWDRPAENDMAEFEQLKADMNRTTRRFTAFVSGYVLLTSTSDVAVCVALGSAFGYAYLQLLMRDVDAFGLDDATAAAFLMQEDSRLELAALRSAKKIFAAYRAALKPRLLVLVALAAAVAAYNSLAPEPLNGLQSGALFGGFFTYKAGQLGQIWDATRPKFDPEALTRPPRPTLYNVEEEELEDVDTEEWKLRLKGKRY